MDGGSRLRVVSYNVQSLRGDRAALVAVVRALRPDVLVLQQAPRRLWWRPRSAALARSLDLVVAAGGMPAMGNLILTDLRVTVADTWCQRFPLTPGRHLRGAAFARCQVGAVSFVVAGSHLSTDPLERPAQAGLLAEAVSAAADPVVLGVDVNDEPPSAAFKTLTEVLVDPAQAPQPTFPAHDPQRRIDAVLVDRRLTVASYQVWDVPQTRRASDHLPVVVEVDLPRPTSGQDVAGQE